MIKKITALFALSGALILMEAGTPASAIQPAKSNSSAARFSCYYTETNPNFIMTGDPYTSYNYTQINFAAHYWTNPYTQTQWEMGIVIGKITGCTSTTRVRGTKVQPDGRVMECTISTSGDVAIRWLSGPPMPYVGPINPYAVIFPDTPMTAY